METRFYYVTYSRLIATGERYIYTDVRMTEDNLISMLLDYTSRYKYIVISARLIEE